MLAAHRVHASTAEQAALYVGATVVFDPENSDNQNDPVITMLGDRAGQIIESRCIPEGHAVWVDFGGMMLPCAQAERFLLKLQS